MSSSQTGDAPPKMSRLCWSLPVPPARPAVRPEVARRLAGRFGSPTAIGGRPRKHAYGAALAALDSDSDDEQNASDSDEALTAMRPRVKRRAQAVEVDDLARVTHDPLLASLRQRLRQRHGAARGNAAIGLRCVFSREAVLRPDEVCTVDGVVDGSLNCAGYGSSVSVTATFGMVAAQLALESCAVRK